MNNKIIRRILRIVSGVVLLVELIFSIIVPKVQGKPVYLDVNDGYIIVGCLAFLLSIELIKKIIDKYLNKVTNK